MAPAPPQIPGLSDWRALARGGFATVWQAKQESLNRYVAVKVDQRRLDDEVERRRFLREAGAAGRMSGHPGIVTVHDAGILDDNRPFLVMELCPGGSLTKWLAADPRPTPERVREVGVRVADALSAAHGRGVLHRDVKPANILVDAYDHPGLADFGLASLPDPGLELSLTIEAITPAYAPPEVFLRQPPTEFGDVYSLAATLYALLCGHPPRAIVGRSSSITEVIARQKEPIESIPGLDETFMSLLLAALTTVTKDRPTAIQFRDRLAALDLAPAESRLDQVASVTADHDGVAETPGHRSAAEESQRAGAHPADRRNRRPVAVIAAVLAIVLIASVLTIVNRRDRPVADPVTTSFPASSASPSGTPTPSPVPSAATTTPPVAGFVDCSSSLGEATFCAVAPECWQGIIALADLPSVATADDCDVTHVYQTFAAGRLEFPVRRQSEVTGDSRVRQTCTTDVVNSMLRARDRRDDWEILVLPPQTPEEDFYRCIFARGIRDTPFVIKPLT